MECREAQKLVNSFIEDKLDSRKLADFLEHIENCESCREELSIQFLVKEGMQRLEDGNMFDLQSELLQKLEAARRRIKHRKMFARVLYYGELAAILIILILTIMVIVL